MNKGVLFTAYVFLITFLIWYLPGFIFSIVYQEYFNYYYNDLGSLGLWHLIWLILIFGFIIIQCSLLSCFVRLKFKKFPVHLVRASALFLVVLFFMLSVMFYFTYDASYRHTNRLSESGFWVSLLWFIKPLIYIIGLVIYLQAIKNSRLNRFSLIVGGFIVVGCILSITSSMEVLVPILFIYLFYRLKFSNIPIKGGFGIIQQLIILFFCALVGILALLIGLGSKLGYDVVFSVDVISVFNILSNEFEFLIPRLSTASASYIYWVNYTMNANVDLYNIWSSINHTIELRSCLIFDNGCTSFDYIDTVNRHNYLSVFAHHAERAGASPGPFASVFLVGNEIVGLFVLSFFYGWIIALVARLVVCKNKISIIYYIVIPLFIMPFFESPLDILYILEPITFQFIFFSLFILFVDVDKTFLND